MRRGHAHAGDYMFCWHGQSTGISSDWIAVDTNSSYEISGWFKAGSTNSYDLIFGVLMADEHLKSIKHVNVFSLQGTRTELAEACREGDRILYLKDASQWQIGKRFAAAFSAEENHLTFKVTPSGIESIRQLEDKWEVGLTHPCGVAMPAGTPVVKNHPGTNGLFIGTRQNPIGPEWQELKIRVTPGQWWHGTAYAQIYITGSEIKRHPRLAAPELWMDDFQFKKIE